MRLVRYIKRKFSRYERWRRVARSAQRSGHWTRAAEALAQAERLRPSAALSVQLGHALKESGQGQAAITAYRHAAAILPDDLDVREHLAAVLRDTGQAVAAAEIFADMLRIDPRCYPAQRALAELGQRRLLPASAMTRALLDERIDRYASAVARMQDARSAWLVTSAFSPAHWGLFRLTYPTPPPPQFERDSRFAALILCDGANAADIRATLDSIVDQAAICCRIILLLPPGTKADERIMAMPCMPLIAQCHDWQTVSRWLSLTEPLAVASAGAALDPQAVAWWGFAARRNDADVVFGDHDFRVDSMPDGGWLAAPCLFGAYDGTAARAATAMPRTPIAAWISPGMIQPSTDALDQAAAAGDVFRALLAAGRTTHVPRVLATFHCRSRPSLAVADDADTVPRKTFDATEGDRAAAVLGADATITIVIPTRDQPELLERCVTSLRRTATHPDRVHIVVVDNRSEQAETHVLLRGLEREGVEVVTDDRAFNWSAINNRAAMQSTTDILLFANNDIESLTAGWDDLVARALADPDVGAVGAKLLYPDRTYQHAGITFGVDEAALSAHEGGGFDEAALGPDGRWVSRRTVAAVTGAFLATRRTRWEAVSGFDEKLAVAYNDLDLCFRLRASGLRILYEPALKFIHYESRTRGRNVGAAKVEWDLREQAIFVKRWGTAARWDPSYSPQWALGGQPFDGYREPPIADVLRHIDCQADGNPWLIAPA